MIQNILKQIFGDKSTKDRKAYQPIIDKSNEIQLTLASISDDELRGKTFYFREKIAKEIAPIEEQIQTLKDKANSPETAIYDKEAIFEKIDKLSKESDTKIEEVLLEIMPEAFAVVKETAKRWTEKGQLVVTAQDFDRDLATRR